MLCFRFSIVLFYSCFCLTFYMLYSLRSSRTYCLVHQQRWRCYINCDMVRCWAPAALLAKGSMIAIRAAAVEVSVRWELESGILWPATKREQNTWYLDCKFALSFYHNISPLTTRFTLLKNWNMVMAMNRRMNNATTRDCYALWSSHTATSYILHNILISNTSLYSSVRRSVLYQTSIDYR